MARGSYEARRRSASGGVARLRQGGYSSSGGSTTARRIWIGLGVAFFAAAACVAASMIPRRGGGEVRMSQMAGPDIAVVDAATGAPLQGVTIAPILAGRPRGRAVTTDASGVARNEFVFSEGFEGTALTLDEAAALEFRFSREGYETLSVPCERPPVRGERIIATPSGTHRLTPLAAR